MFDRFFKTGQYSKKAISEDSALNRASKTTKVISEDVDKLKAAKEEPGKDLVKNSTCLNDLFAELICEQAKFGVNVL